MNDFCGSGLQVEFFEQFVFRGDLGLERVDKGLGGFYLGFFL